MADQESVSTNLSNEERIQYWASCTPGERLAAGWQMTVAHYKALGLWKDGQGMDKTLVQLCKRSTAERDHDS